MRAAEAARALARALGDGTSAVEIVVVGGPRAGARALLVDRELVGGLGDPELDRAAREAARDALAAGRASTIALPTNDAEHTVYIQPHHPPDELVIVGAGHIARPLARVGALLGFSVAVADDRPEFATTERFPDATRLVRLDATDPLRPLRLTTHSHLVLVTRGHKYDFEVLRAVLRPDVAPAYIGMIGSARRVRAAFERLAAEGIEPAVLGRIHAPIGLDIGAETPEEIAVAIAAELVMVRRGGGGGRSRDRARVVRRWIEGLDSVRSADLPARGKIQREDPETRTPMPERLIPVEQASDIPEEYRGTPVGQLLEYHNLGVEPKASYTRAELLVGMCMDHRKRLHIPDNFAYIIRAGGANLRPSEFQVSYAIAVGGVRAIALIGHTHCGMVSLAARHGQFVEGLVEGAGWEAEAAEAHFQQFAPLFEIGNEVDFVLSESGRLRLRYPRVLVAPLLYRVEDNRLYLIRESVAEA